jgi:phage gp46-like protein
METTDIVLFETGSGGDFSIVNEDLLMGESFYQQVYLALFGGNIEESTKDLYLESEERFDYWANSLLFKNEPTKQFNSQTERAIQNNALNSSGRLNIIQAMNVDLAYLKSLANITIDVQITGRDNLRLIVNFIEISNQQDRSLQMVYDNAKKEVIIEKII